MRAGVQRCALAFRPPYSGCSTLRPYFVHAKQHVHAACPSLSGEHAFFRDGQHACDCEDEV
eukprot:2062152-Prymnesium_polylepis.1